MGAGGAAIIGERGVEDGAKRPCRDDVSWAGAKPFNAGIAIVAEQVEVVSNNRSLGSVVVQLWSGPTVSSVAGDQRAVEGEGATVTHAAARGASVARDRGIGQG